MRSKASPKKKAFASYLRRNQTWPEKKMGKVLVENFPSIPIYKQSIAFGYILDFYIKANKPNAPYSGLAIEVDGPHHLQQVGYDLHRDAVLKSKGIKTIRFDLGSMKNNMPAVIALIGYQLSLIRV